MRKTFTRTLSKYIAFSLPIIFGSCYSSQQLVQPSLSQKVARNPSFLDDLSLPNNNKNHGIAISSENRMPGNAAIDVSKTNTLQARFAAMMNVVPQSITNLSLYKFIDEWYGVRYRLGGNDKSGIDCSAFVQRVYSQVFGLNLLRTAFEQFNTSKLIWSATHLQEGDLVFFRINSSRISHVGVYLMNNFFVHASSSKGVMISSLDEHYWQQYFSCAGRMM